MSLFAARAGAPAVTGIDVLRQALAARLHKNALQTVARDIGCGVERLEFFARGQGSLPSNILTPLAKELYGGHIEFNPETQLLRPANRAEPISLGMRPPQCGRRPLSEIVPPPVVTGRVMQVVPQRKARPGWE